MEGKSDPGVLNYLSKHRSLGERVDAADLMDSLLEHPGWGYLERIVDEMAERHGENLAREADIVARSVDPEQAIRYAGMKGVVNGLTFHRDVVASVLKSAKTAAQKLEETAVLDEAAEGN